MSELNAPHLALVSVLALLASCSPDAVQRTSFNPLHFDPATEDASLKDSFVEQRLAFQTDTFTLTERTVHVLFDSLQCADPGTRQHWAKALVRTWPHSDGALSEALSGSGLTYTEKHAAEFISLFGPKEPDMLIWADLVSGEMIIADLAPFESVGPYINGLKQRCTGCGEGALKRLDHFQQLIEVCLSSKLK
ncbi:MAG: hypothetical protein ABIY71_02685 [Flavobacteriales bacterium]